MDQAIDMDVVRLDLPARHKYLNILGGCLKALLERVEEVENRDLLAYNVELALYETCTNIVEHAYAGNPGRIKIDFKLTDGPRQLVVDVRDTGESFDLSQVPEPSVAQNDERGYGLFLVHALLDEVSYQPQSGNNLWRLIKNI